MDDENGALDGCVLCAGGVRHRICKAPKDKQTAADMSPVNNNCPTCGGTQIIPARASHSDNMAEYMPCPDCSALITTATEAVMLAESLSRRLKEPNEVGPRLRALAKEWAAIDNRWTTQETVERNLRLYALAVLAIAKFGGPQL